MAGRENEVQHEMRREVPRVAEADLDESLFGRLRSQALALLISISAAACSSPRSADPSFDPDQPESAERMDSFGYFNLVRWDGRDLILAMAGKTSAPRGFSIAFSRPAADGGEMDVVAPESYVLEEGQDSVSVTLPPQVRPGDTARCLIDGAVAGQPITVPASTSEQISGIQY